MNVSNVVKNVIKDEGRTQSWVVAEMNRIDPALKMDRAKLSAIACGNRKMTGDELIAFCKAVRRSPDIFLNRKQESTT